MNLSACNLISRTGLLPPLMWTVNLMQSNIALLVVRSVLGLIELSMKTHGLGLKRCGTYLQYPMGSDSDPGA